MPHKTSKTIVISGQIVNVVGMAHFGYIVIKNGTILSVSEEKPTIPQGAITYDAGKEAYIFPGFIDLHTHIEYNLLPMWKNPHMYRWDNRFQWRNNDDSNRALEEPLDAIHDIWNQKLKVTGRPPVCTVFQALSEIQAITGGTTVIQQKHHLDEACSAYSDREHVLIRNTGMASNLGFSSTDTIYSKEDFYKPTHIPEGRPYQDSTSWKAKTTEDFEEFLSHYTSGNLKGTLIHLAEGRAGYLLSEQGVDPYTRHEAEQFMQAVSKLEKELFKKINFSSIHSCGFDLFDPQVTHFLKEYNIGIIWSPVSNLLLYGDTLCASKLLEDGVVTALGSDWSPSGSKNVLEEAKFARFFRDTLQLPISDLEIYHMITKNPAKLLNLPAGEIAKGHFADLFILDNSKNPQCPPLDALFSSDDRSTTAVIVGGSPIYGDKEVFEAFEMRTEQLPQSMGTVASSKWIHYPHELNIDLSADLKEVQQLLKAEGVPSLSLPLPSDDLFYQDVMEELKHYTTEAASKANIK